MREIEILSRQLAREKNARKEAESLAEIKSRVLYKINLELTNLTINLSDKEKNTRAILEATADGIIVLDGNYQVVLSNQAACQLFNYQEDELLKKNIDELIDSPKDNSSENTISNIFAAENTDVLVEASALRKDKSPLPVELAISKVMLTQSLSFICVIRNIYERKLAEHRSTLQHEIILILTQNTSLDEVIQNVLKKMCEAMQLEVGSYWQVDFRNSLLRCKNVYCKEGKDIETYPNTLTFAPGIGLPGRVWLSRTPCWIDDVIHDTNFFRTEWAKTAGLQIAFAFPIIVNHEVHGVIEFFMSHFHSFDDAILPILNDVCNQLGIFIEREYAQRRIKLLSRLKGMSEVASSVLHNVGNTLNSINTSIEMMSEKLNNSEMKNLKPLASLIHQHQNNLEDFITKDPKGKQSLDFIQLLSKEWDKEKKYYTDEIKLLKKNVKDVMKIIAMQQSINYKIGIFDEVFVNDLIEDALSLNKIAYEHAQIKIIRNYQPVKKAFTDRVKLLQIVVNLAKNSIDALQDSKDQLKQIVLNLSEHNATHFKIQLIDNGIGINPEHLTQIFSRGFTTKNNGHGFGLHASALFAKELGGSLCAESKGIGLGATFTLIIPYEATLKN